MQIKLTASCFATIWLAFILPCQAGKIHDAVAKRDAAALDKALKDEPKQVNARCFLDFDTPLFMAVGLGDVDVVKLLVASGADVNTRCPAWMTPLHFATLRNTDRSVSDLLLAKGADVDAVDRFGRTPLMFAARMGSAKGVEELITAGAALDAEDIHRQSVICHAAGGGNDAFVKLIYQKGGRDLTRTAKPEALSRTAAASGSMDLMEILLADGLDVNIRDEVGFTPLLTALERDRREVADFLLSKGAEPMAFSTTSMSTNPAPSLSMQGKTAPRKSSNSWKTRRRWRANPENHD